MAAEFLSLSVTLSYVAAIVMALLACVVAAKDRRSFANRAFIATLALLSLMEVFRWLGTDAILADDALFWQWARLACASLLPGTCFLFSITFARAEYSSYLARWKYVIAAVLVLPPLTLILGRGPFFTAPPMRGPSDQFVFPLGITGKIFYLLVLLSAVLVLANLERTLRASTGRIRWQIKFIVLGMGSICAVWIYTSSQALIYSVLDTPLSILYPGVLFVASIFFVWGLTRSRFLNVDVYLSRTTIQYSLTALLAGIYLVALGLLAYRVRAFDSKRPLHLDALLVLFALVGLAMFLLSDRLQERLKRFITRHFKRPLYDYRRAWMELNEKTNSLVGVYDLCAAVARIVSQTFGILSVNIWLCDEATERLFLMGSTVFTRVQARELERSGRPVEELLRALQGGTTIIDLEKKNHEWADEIMRARPEYFGEFRMSYILPLQAGGQLVGIMTLNSDRVGKAPLSAEDQALLHAYAAQLAARVLQLRMAENQRKAQEVEAFQNASAFFVHDLKNLASRLSLTMQNLPAYFDNPEFRGDALKLIGESVVRIDATCSRLSSLKQKLELHILDADLNELVTRTLDEFEKGVNVPLQRDLQTLPRVALDPEQVQKVLTNLVWNAVDASGGKGAIRVETLASNHRVQFSVTDDGCGMSQQFIETMLFRPFQSTKKRGMGIGLFQSKMIVEAHHGRIDVVSQEGQGTTFRVILPVNQTNP
jgi:putative PEP-CTERM system histidine kinase